MATRVEREEFISQYYKQLMRAYSALEELQVLKKQIPASLRIKHEEKR